VAEQASPPGAGAGRRGAAARRAGAALLTALGAFAGLQLAFTAAVETVCSDLRDPLYACRLERVRRRAPAGGPRCVVMLGSSRTQAGFKAAALEGPLGESLGRPAVAFNFGVAGGGPLTELLTWRRLRRDGARPDLLLVEVLPPLLTASVPPAELNEERLPADRLRWSDLALVERYASRPDLRRDWRLGGAAPFYGRRLALVSRLAPGLLPQGSRMDGAWRVDPSGGVPTTYEYPTPEQRQRALARAREEYRYYLSDFRLGGPACDGLCELLASCRQDGVPAALVLMPEGPVFRSWYPPGAGRAVRDWLEAVGERLDVPLIDAREWMEEDDFVDSHHLLPEAAGRFTRRLGSEGVLPLLRRAEGGDGP
jgi:hypothetical protein